MFQESCTQPVYQLSLSENWCGYEQILREKNMQLMELQFYINKIARCLGIVDILSASRQDNQFKTLIKCSTIFTSRLSTNHKNIQQASDLLSISEQYTSPKHQYPSKLFHSILKPSKPCLIISIQNNSSGNIWSH